MNTASENVMISTIVLNWNRVDLLRKTVLSYLSTVTVDYELIIIDNNSQDESREFIKTVCADKPNHYAILLDENLGGEALNIALAQAKGQFIHISENDLEYLPGWDVDLLSKFYIFPELGQLSPFSPFHQIERGEIWVDKPAIKQEKSNLILYEALGNVGTTCLIRREVWERGVRWRSLGNSTYWAPDDGTFSKSVKALGYTVGWNDKYVVINWGHNVTEMSKRIEYYINNAEGKSFLRLDGLIKCLKEHGYELKKNDKNVYFVEQVTPPHLSQAYASSQLWQLWMEWLRTARQELSELIPSGSKFVLLDDEVFGHEVISQRNGIVFLEQEGQYGGPPSEDESAIGEVERLRDMGAQFVAFVWPAFWWVDYYDVFFDFLCANYKCILENERLIVFNLREAPVKVFNKNVWKTRAAKTTDFFDSSEDTDVDKISLWYYRMANGRNNFGDLLGKYIAEKLSGKRVRHTNLKSGRPVYVTIGSVLNTATGLHTNCTVWGSGIISADDEVPSDLNILAVRGPVTQRRLRDLGIKPPTAYGDPALLLNKIYQPSASLKLWDVGIIPHYVDLSKVKNRITDRSIKVIDLITDEIEQTIDEIVSCKYIISSSLHGVVVAHTYGIPAVWVQFSDKLSGDNIKFEDYFASVGIEPYIGENFSNKPLIKENIIRFVKSYSPNNLIVSFDQDLLLQSCPFLNEN
jgi:glycosyltransferase involved in cell wall biosynthesis